MKSLLNIINEKLKINSKSKINNYEVFKDGDIITTIGDDGEQYIAIFKEIQQKQQNTFSVYVCCTPDNYWIRTELEAGKHVIVPYNFKDNSNRIDWELASKEDIKKLNKTLKTSNIKWNSKKLQLEKI